MRQTAREARPRTANTNARARYSGPTLRIDPGHEARMAAQAAFLLWWAQMAGTLERLYQDICHINAEVNRPDSPFADVFEFNDLRELQHDLSHASCQMMATQPTIRPDYANPLAVLATAAVMTAAK